MLEEVINFPSELKNLTIAESLVDKLSMQFHLSNEIYGNILISLIEAVNNAITHGNKGDASKKVFLKYTIDKGLLSFRIMDEGQGFDYNSTPDPTKPENIEKPDGRGIFLMKNLSDEMNFYNNGKEVELKFQIK